MDVTTAVWLPFAALPPAGKLWETLFFQVFGLIVLFLALGSLLGLIALTRWFFRISWRTPKPLSAAATTLAASGLPPEILAAIAAAVHCVFNGQRFEIASARLLEPDLYWAREGRRSLLLSHKTR